MNLSIESYEDAEVRVRTPKSKREPEAYSVRAQRSLDKIRQQRDRFVSRATKEAERNNVLGYIL